MSWLPRDTHAGAREVVGRDTGGRRGSLTWWAWERLELGRERGENKILKNQKKGMSQKPRRGRTRTETITLDLLIRQPW